MSDHDKAEIKVHPDWKDEVTNPNGDTDLIATTVTLVSSNQVHFHVPRYLLMANSPVLKDMLSLPTTNKSQKVELSDDALESAASLAFYLSVLIGKDGKVTLEEGYKTRIVRTCHAAILLAVKWESALVLRGIAEALLSFNIPSSLEKHKEVRALDIFLLAHEGDMTAVAATVLQTYEPNIGGGKPNPSHWGGYLFKEDLFKKEGSAFKLDYLNHDVWAQLGTDYIFALTKSQSDRNEDGIYRSISFANHLKDIRKAQKQSPLSKEE
ncbi:hypothetical protein L198_06935 [Cryptococcus wingfieldii CBS 7118]|uniref:BTB domain-containing protein n=1 Tax=Cryptococcus wingfieldii CBS 7118 TaxID=1295528 RepID=A0A1E3IGI7_9TREE|nr:hypothetical protein L198_06935 [Cryptococcus wingfieldii CBS 7118]ODN87709.1 hypothetical protein L198_06935 [Cryptococcus wingfieldii CBS 7118]